MTQPTRLAPVFGAVLRPIQAFFKLEAGSSILLFCAAVCALVWVNVDPGSYHAFFDLELDLGAGGQRVPFSLVELVNDGLMTIFFFVVGMEIKRELVLGELRNPAAAALPAIAAVGGMVVPALLFHAFNHGQAGQVGWGVPMATDIAFSIGCLTLSKGRVPHGLVVFLTALAIFDDIGGILVIAFFYGRGVDVGWLLTAMAITLALGLAGRLYVKSAFVYAAGGAALWYAFHRTGVHATISGVVLGLLVPARTQRTAREVLQELADHASRIAAKEEEAELERAEILEIEGRLEELSAPLDRFVHALHPYVAFGIVPLFALANSGVDLRGLGREAWFGPVTLGCAVGLFVGKQLGIFGATMLAVRARIAPLPSGATLPKLYGVSVVGGIGFTVALFIAALAFGGQPGLLDQAKLGILCGSLVAGAVGCLLLRATGLPADPGTVD